MPEGYSDEQALLTEPVACAVHTALRAGVRPNDRVLVSGAGSVGLFATLALRELTPAGEIIVVAKHGHQREIAYELRAPPRWSRPRRCCGGSAATTGAFQLEPEFSSPYLLGGVDVAVDAVGSKQSLETALHATRAGGRVVMSGMPARRRPVGRLVPRARGRRHLRVLAEESGPTALPSASRSPPSWSRTTRSPQSPSPSPAIRCTAGARPSTMRTRAGRLGTVKVAFDPRSSHR